MSLESKLQDWHTRSCNFPPIKIPKTSWDDWVVKQSGTGTTLQNLIFNLVWTRFKKSVEIEFHTVPEFPKEKPTPPKYAYLDELKLRVQKID